jgi:hypothetical protein
MPSDGAYGERRIVTLVGHGSDAIHAGDTQVFDLQVVVDAVAGTLAAHT